MTHAMSLETLALVRTDDLFPGATRWLLGATHPAICRGQTHIATNIDGVDAEAWDTVVANRGLYFQRAYLGAVEAGSDGEVEHRYAQFYRDGSPLGVACFQIARFAGPAPAPLLGSCPATRAAAWMAGVEGDKVSASVIVCGSTFNCGETGFAFAPEVGPQEATDLINEAIRRIQAGQESSRRSAAVLFKEFGTRPNPVTAMLEHEGYCEITAGPRMVLDLDPSWSSWEDYLGALKSKFRVKAKRAYGKSRQLEMRDLGVADLLDHRARLEALHGGVVDKADYRLGAIGVDALPLLRGKLADELVIRGYFLDGELVGFMTGFVLGDTIDAHVVGFDYALNRAHSIYPRMLCDYLRIALDRGLVRVNYGRTAEEIKSTLGAVPQPTRCYLRHRSPIINPLVGLVTRSMDPPTPTLRQPFKAATAGGRRAA